MVWAADGVYVSLFVLRKVFSDTLEIKKGKPFLFIYFSLGKERYIYQSMIKTINKNENNKGIFNKNNPYGYRLNLNNEQIRDLYFRYMKWKGLPLHFPLSDQQRFEFEDFVLKQIEK